MKKKCRRIARGIIAMIFLCFSVGMFLAREVQATEKVVVGTNAEYAPFEYRDSDGNLTGFDYELLQEIAKTQDLELSWSDLPFDSLIGSMEAGDIQIIAAAIGPTEERARSVEFSDVYYTGSQSIVYGTGKEISRFEDLKGKKIAVLEGSVSDLIVSGENTDYGIVEGAEVVRFKTASNAVMELKNQSADAVVIDTIMAEIYCRQTEGISYKEVPGTQEDTVFCIQKGNAKLKEAINNGLDEVRKNGTYDKLYEKYFPVKKQKQFFQMRKIS